jgi:hypothetical protein
MATHDIVNAGVKILLFFYCYALRKQSSQVEVLWEDHRNDLWINFFGKACCNAFRLYKLITHTGILMSAGGSKLRWCSYFYLTLSCDITNKDDSRA